MRGLTEAEALRRTGAVEESIRPLSYAELVDKGLFPGTVLAGRLGDWVVLIGRNQGRAPDSAAVSALSRGTEMVSVLRHDYASDYFIYAVDGDEVTGFDPRKPAWRYGSDPERLLEEMGHAGLDPAYPPSDDDEWDESVVHRPAVDGALVLAARLAGVAFTHEVLHGPLTGGRRAQGD
ncbi:DUF6461 domain-containing protein [Sinosporangium siamense]|uniref:DUF6461 domain-containing protein n=1 Tax=Sinosporangium siamense TaxID=1367973 RepID=UPI0035EC26DE